jgi:hypothetical protein
VVNVSEKFCEVMRWLELAQERVEIESNSVEDTFFLLSVGSEGNKVLRQDAKLPLHASHVAFPT